MGTTLGNLHLYTLDGQEAAKLKSFEHDVLRLSDGWISILDRSFQTDAINKEAKRISKAVAAPVLSFSLFDDEYIAIRLWKDGRRIGEYTDYPTSSLRGGSAFEQNLGLNVEDMSRFRLILSCGDTWRKAELLEELFGVAFIVDTDCLEGGTESFVRHRSRELFDAYLAEKNRMNSIKNKTKAVLTQEIRAKIACLDGNMLLSYPDENGVHPHDKIEPYILENGSLMPLLGDDIHAGIPVQILTNGRQVTVLKRLYDPEKGEVSWPLAVQYNLGGSRIRQIPLPDKIQRFSCMLADGSIIAQQVKDTQTQGWGRPWLLCIAADGSIRWRMALEGGQFDGDAYIHEGHIYVATQELRTGITLYKVDFLGNILCERNFPQVLGLDFRHLKQGRLLCIVREPAQQERNCWSIMILDEKFATRLSFGLPHGIWPVIHARFGGGLLDEQEKNLYFTALDSKVVRVDLDALECHAEHIPGLCGLDCMDQGGLLYCSQNNSTVCVLDRVLHLISRHPLKGSVCHMQPTGTGVYVITSAGDSAMWGKPEKCIVRVYRI